MTDEQLDQQPDDQTADGQDDALRAQLRTADPAASLPAADPTRVARLLEDTMADPLTDESRSDGTRGRSPLTWLVAAAAFVVIGGGAVFALTRGDDAPTEQAGTTPSAGPSDAASEQTTTELGIAADAAVARCRPPTDATAVVAQQDVALDGVVERISGTMVTLRPTTWYAGDETDLVLVRAPGPGLEALLSAVAFEEGGRYLVSASDGLVTLCGFTAPWSATLADDYAEAFPR